MKLYRLLNLAALAGLLLAACSGAASPTTSANATALASVASDAAEALRESVEKGHRRRANSRNRSATWRWRTGSGVRRRSRRGEKAPRGRLWRINLKES